MSSDDEIVKALDKMEREVEKISKQKALAEKRLNRIKKSSESPKREEIITEQDVQNTKEEADKLTFRIGVALLSGGATFIYILSLSPADRCSPAKNEMKKLHGFAKSLRKN